MCYISQIICLSKRKGRSLPQISQITRSSLTGSEPPGFPPSSPSMSPWSTPSSPSSSPSSSTPPSSTWLAQFAFSGHPTQTLEHWQLSGITWPQGNMPEARMWKIENSRSCLGAQDWKNYFYSRLEAWDWEKEILLLRVKIGFSSHPGSYS